MVAAGFCSVCGRAWPDGTSWPRVCAGCGRHDYRNPIPVCVMLVPVDKGLLTVRRNVEPKRGSLAFPGGYVDLNETWQEAGVRELWEETGIKAAASDVTEVAVISSVERGILVVFGSLPPRPESDLPPFQPNKETTGWEIVTAPCELAFQSHTEVMARWFATRRV